MHVGYFKKQKEEDRKMGGGGTGGKLQEMLKEGEKGMGMIKIHYITM